MRRILVLEVTQLQPGFVLADDLRRDTAGLSLYPADTVLTEQIIERIVNMGLEAKVLVYDPDSLVEKVVHDFASGQLEAKVEPEQRQEVLTDTAPGQDVKEQEQINLSPQKISRQALKIYNSTFKTVKSFYQAASLSGYMDMHQAKKAASELSDEIVRDPQVLLQISVLKAIDDYTFSHAIHVAVYATTLARLLGFSTQEMKQISLAGLLHDIGKMDIPLEILNKPDSLNPDEYKTIKEHVRHGYKRVCSFKDVDSKILYAIGQHHERMDGTGYPLGLKGPEIHKWARIIAIADVYDAVTSKRVYKDAILPHEGAEILMGSVGHLDHGLAKMFLKYISVYPVGCEVMLSSGETGKVIATNPDLPTRPFVQLTGKDGQGARVINLSNSLTTFITGIIKE